MTIKTETRAAQRTVAEPAPTTGPSGRSIRTLIADTLDIERHEVIASLALHDIPEWSSLDHVTLMLAIEEHVGRTIDGRTTARLTTVEAIESWAGEDRHGETRAVEDRPGRSGTGHQSSAEHAGSNQAVQRGLDGVFIDTSEITSIDGANGELLIRGFAIEDLAKHAELAEVAHLVLYGARPTALERNRMVERLVAPAPLPVEVASLVERWNDRHPMVALRTAISLLGRGGPDGRVRSASCAVDRGLELAGWSLEILGRHLAARFGHPIDEPTLQAEVDGRWPVSARFLATCFGMEPDPIEAEALDLVWRLQVDHGSNASAFAARVTVSAGTDVDGAILAGLATFAGALHGGAVQGVVESLREIGGRADAAPWVENRRARREPIMGYGHRVYRVADPRSAPLRAMAARLAEHRGDRWPLDTMAGVEAAMAPYERAGLGMNIDSYASVIYHQLGFPDDYHTALYAVARILGWTAHIAEQVESNVLIRPRLAYRGPDRRRWERSGSPGGEREARRPAGGVR